MTFEPRPTDALLKGAAATGLAALAVAGLEESVTAATLQGSLPSKVDVVVVGGGLSGLVAARKVARVGPLGAGRRGPQPRRRPVAQPHAGRRRRDRGRRRVRRSDPGPHPGPGQASSKVATFPEYIKGKNVYISADGRLELYTGTVPPDPRILLDAALLLKQLDKFAAEMPVDAPWTHPKAAEWDSMTLGEYIRKNTPQQGRHREPDQVLDPARLRRRPRRALAAVRDPLPRLLGQRDAPPGTFELQLQHRRRRPGEPVRRRLPAGAAEAGAAARRPGRPERRRAPDRPARRPRQSCRLARQRHAARQVIVAVPPPLVLDIDWYPQLPAQRPHCCCSTWRWAS